MHIFINLVLVSNGYFYIVAKIKYLQTNKLYKKSLTRGLLVLKVSGGVYGGAMATVQSLVEAVRNGGQELVTEDLAVLE